MNTASPTTGKSRLRKRKGTSHHRSKPAITFGNKSLTCLFVFAVIYGTFMICFQPMLREENATTLRDSLKHIRKPHKGVKNKLRHKLKLAKAKWIEREKHLEEHLVDKMKNTSTGRAAMDNHDSSGHQSGNTQKKLEKKELNHQLNVVKPGNTNILQNEGKKNLITVDENKPVGGFMVLGMHRSGTSMLSGLLVEGFGYKPGQPLIQPAYDNEKGFYELIPAVLQNDVFMANQNIDWATNVKNYDAELALERHYAGVTDFARGTNAVRFLNDVNSRPWLQKDPRMCITMRTWLPLLNSRPAIIFTYRHPLEVALSLGKRQGFKLAYGLRLWIQYNKAAVLNSADLCRVLSSNNAVLADPMNETKRIAEELTKKCNVPPPPKMIDTAVVNSFVDTSLQHGKNQLKKKDAEKQLLVKHGDCEVKDYDSVELPGSDAQEREKDLYLKAMKIYCDFESGIAYEATYEWPDISAQVAKKHSFTFQ